MDMFRDQWENNGLNKRNGQNSVKKGLSLLAVLCV